MPELWNQAMNRASVTPTFQSARLAGWKTGVAKPMLNLFPGPHRAVFRFVWRCLRNIGSAGAKRVGLKELTTERLVAYNLDDYPECHETLAALFRPFGGTPPLAEDLDSANSLITAVEARRGVALAPSCLACLAGPRLRLRELPPPPAPIIVGVGYRSGGLCPVGKRFVKLLRTLDPANLNLSQAGLAKPR